MYMLTWNEDNLPFMHSTTNKQTLFLIKLYTISALCAVQWNTQVYRLHTVNTYMYIYSQTCLKRPLKGQKKSGLLTQVNYSDKCTFGGLKGQFLSAGGLKDKFDCTVKYNTHISFHTGCHFGGDAMFLFQAHTHSHL